MPGGIKRLFLSRVRNLSLRVAVFISLLTVSGSGAPLQLVSKVEPSLTGATGDGNSWLPIISSDGRYVLFASTANNLMVATNGNSIPALSIPKLNVFLRDRTNGTTTLVSVNLSGTAGGSGDSLPTGISTNSRYVLFESTASDLVTNDTKGFAAIFVRDLINNATILISVSTNGGAGNGVSRGSTMTPDGRFVAFVSAASNLVPDDTNGLADVFVRDLQGGTTTLASAGATSTKGQNFLFNSSESPDITSDGRYVVFYSTATNLVPGVTASGDIYVRDLVGGVTTWATTGARTAVRAVMSVTNAVSYNHAISADGQYVAYEASPRPASGTSSAGIILRYNVPTGITEVVNTNAFVPAGIYETIRSLDITSDGRFVAFVANANGTSGTTSCIYLWDGLNGTTTLISGDLSNSVPLGSICQWPTFDPTGGFITFLSSATHLTTNSLIGDYHLYARDLQAGTTTLIDADTNGVGSMISPGTIPRPSANARFVAFEALDGTLALEDRNRDPDIFVRDFAGNAVELISSSDGALPSSTPDGWSTLTSSSLSMDGRYVAFSSEADNLVANDTNGFCDVFVRDLASGANIAISVTTNGVPGDSVSMEPSISADGRYVAFSSAADNLVPGDTNQVLDVFLRDLQSGTTTLVSVSTNGNSANGASSSPIVSADAGHVLFVSKALNLAPGTGLGPNLFSRDLNSGVTYALTSTGVGYSTTHGRFVLFTEGLLGLFLWDSQINARVYSINSNLLFSALGVSSDGNELVYVASSKLQAVDRAANVSRTIGDANSRAAPQFSADGRFLTYAGGVIGFKQIYLYDFQLRTNVLLSKSPGSSAPGNGDSFLPNISSDARFVVYRSVATNLIPGDTNGRLDLFLYDRLSGATTLVSASRFGSSAADNGSLNPVFSGDARTLAFQSSASDLVPNDFNRNSDIFALNLYPSNAIGSFAVQALPTNIQGQGPTLIWPAVPGKTYSVQFKNSLTDPSWQPLSGEVALVGDRAYFTDLATPPSQRFYRVVGY